MNDDVKEQNSTPPEELKRQIVSYSEPKNEREWWAMHRIEQLEALIALIEDLDPNVMDEARAALEGKDGETV